MRDYLTYLVGRLGADGMSFRAVEFDEKLSDPENWTKLRYRIRWKGGYQTGPGQ